MRLSRRVAVKRTRRAPFLARGKSCCVDSDKITKYLLNLNHPDGGPKAKFFLAGGFSLARPYQFATALIRHYEDNEPTKLSAHRLGGSKLVIEAPLPVPDGRQPRVRSVWRVPEGGRIAHFVTAYPLD